MWRPGETGRPLLGRNERRYRMFEALDPRNWPMSVEEYYEPQRIAWEKRCFGGEEDPCEPGEGTGDYL